jgi:undecaprenyl-diphosphatase
MLRRSARNGNSTKLLPQYLENHMPNSLTTFAAHYLVFIEALVALIALVPWFLRANWEDRTRWFIACLVMVVVAEVLAKIGAHVYSDPRPFAVDHVAPLVSHAKDNGFPSDHALLAAAIVGALLVARQWLWAIPCAVLGFCVDWARVGAGIHHVIDVLGSTGFVLIGLAIGLAIAFQVAEPLAQRISGASNPARSSSR